MKIRKLFLNLALIFLDISFIVIGLYIGLILRYDGIIPADFSIAHHIYLVFVFMAYLFIFGIYKSLWAYGSIKEFIYVCLSCILATATSVIFEIFLIRDKIQIPFTALVMAGFVITFLVAGSRIMYRFARRTKIYFDSNSGLKARRTMILGAGNAASIIIREMKTNSNINNKPIIILDDDYIKHGKRLHGIKIVEGLNKINYWTEKYQITDIVLAIPSLPKTRQKEILLACSKTGCSLHIMPSLSSYFLKDKARDVIRPVNMGDLLGREEVELDIKSINEYLENKTVLITGGGGSIGSEIARQLIKFKIKKMVLMDINENGIYELYHELKISLGCKVDVEIIIGSIRDQERLKQIFEEYRPNIVYHAAAHKHVPLMEACPGEAVKNNVMGTLNVANLADDYNVEKFILISTDKAVNPTSIMGATKRICEMIIQAINVQSKTKFSAVRFGNVLGSNGSVVPLFKKQIEAGGPVTVTHPEIVRYFMTISEASKLVIQAGAISEGGEIFVLDMGEPMKIIDLAKNMISLSGLTPDVDIKINFTGLRPGEKLYEELLYNSTQQKTIYEKIFVENTEQVNYADLIGKIAWLVARIESCENAREILSQIIPMHDEDKEATPN